MAVAHEHCNIDGKVATLGDRTPVLTVNIKVIFINHISLNVICIMINVVQNYCKTLFTISNCSYPLIFRLFTFCTIRFVVFRGGGKAF